MIGVDTSALIAILRQEDGWSQVADRLTKSEQALMSAGTLVETLIVARERGVGPRVDALLAETAIEIVPVDEQLARIAGDAYSQFGRGNHPARLNFGDCFAYALAKARDLPLLYVGDDFARTDVRSAL